VGVWVGQHWVRCAATDWLKGSLPVVAWAIGGVIAARAIVEAPGMGEGHLLARQRQRRGAVREAQGEWQKKSQHSSSLQSESKLVKK
jgi:hypothetical protein